MFLSLKKPTGFRGPSESVEDSCFALQVAVRYPKLIRLSFERVPIMPNPREQGNGRTDEVKKRQALSVECLGRRTCLDTGIEQGHAIRNNKLLSVG